jgi:CBS domain-containing protein
MTVADILKTKGSAVKTVRPDETVKAFAKRLKDAHIGAMIVTNDGNSIDGIISERDLAYGIAAFGDELLGMRVSDLMTRGVIVCAPEDSIAAIMRVMTQRRVRHLPVKDGSKLVGIVSSGDVMKHRLGEVEMEASVLRDVAIARR